MSPRNLIGKWTDSYGNSVNVRATDAFGLHLLATLSRPPRPDIHLKFRQVETGAGWLCGEATLDATLGPAGGKPTELFWCFPTGDVSVWVRAGEPEDSNESPREFDGRAPLPWSQASSESLDGLDEPWHTTLQAPIHHEPYVCVACVPQTVWVAQTFFVPQAMPMYFSDSSTNQHHPHHTYN
uniref:Uncharacterized protein n=1 Tax=Alexandrium catenella TaxID=2925 RepID=A0A7S1WKY3_ALECA